MLKKISNNITLRKIGFFLLIISLFILTKKIDTFTSIFLNNFFIIIFILLLILINLSKIIFNILIVIIALFFFTLPLLIIFEYKTAAESLALLVYLIFFVATIHIVILTCKKV